MGTALGRGLLVSGASMPIVSDPSGVISTEDRTQQHTEWPCVPDGHAAEVSCEDAIAAWARRNGTRVLVPDSADPQGDSGGR